MFEAPRNWFRRNRTRLTVGAGIVGVGYFAGQYIWGKITETRQRISDERIAQENLRRRFQQNQEDCTYTVLALIPTATENIVKAIPVENILQELQSRKADKRPKPPAGSETAPSEIPSTVEDEERSFTSSSYVHASHLSPDHGGEERRIEANLYASMSKAQLWNQLKMSSITRAFTLVYTLSLLTLLTRIQLNLLGRRTYLSSVVSLASSGYEEAGISLENRDDDNMDQGYGEDFDTNRMYLTYSWWLLHRGWTIIMEEVEEAVKNAFGSLKPGGEITFEQLSECILDVRKKVEGASWAERRSHKWLPCLLPSASDEELVLRESGIAISSTSNMASRQLGDYSVTPSLRRLMDETSDLIDSPTFNSVLTLLLDSSFSLLVDRKISIQAYKTEASAAPVQAAPMESVTDSPLKATVHGNLATEASTQTKVKLATILALFTREARIIGSGGDLAFVAPSDMLGLPTFGEAVPKASNEYLSNMELVGNLEAFAAVIYSSNFDTGGSGIGNNSTSDGAEHHDEDAVGSSGEGSPEADGV